MSSITKAFQSLGLCNSHTTMTLGPFGALPDLLHSLHNSLLSSGWFCANSAGASQQSTITEFTLLATTLNVILARSSPIIKPSRNVIIIELSPNSSNQLLFILSRIKPTQPERSPTIKLVRSRLLFTKSSEIITSKPLALNNVMTFFPDSK